MAQRVLQLQQPQRMLGLVLITRRLGLRQHVARVAQTSSAVAGALSGGENLLEQARRMRSVFSRLRSATDGWRAPSVLRYSSQNTQQQQQEQPHQTPDEKHDSQQQQQQQQQHQQQQQGNQQKKPNNNQDLNNGVWMGMLWASAGMLAYYTLTSRTARNEISWQQFKTAFLEQGIVSKIEIIDRTQAFVFVNNNNSPVAYFTIGSVESFETQMHETQEALGVDPHKYIPITYSSPLTLGQLITNFAPSLLILGTVLFLQSRMTGARGGGPGGIFNSGRSKAKLITPEMVNVKFADVAGMNEAKQEIMEFVNFLKTPKVFEELGAKIPKGALLSGPPGTGKTLLAKATAGEAGVPFFSTSGSEFLEMFVGVGPARVRDLFEQAKRNTPCIIFIDEIDAIGRARGNRKSFGGNDERENTLNQILVEMDGFDASKGVIVLAGTNRSDVLDPALLRPGRFDRHIVVDRPDLSGRVDIFKVHLRKIKLKDTVDHIAQKFAQLTPGFTGADIANVCNEAALIAGRKSADIVNESHFEAAIERVVGGLERKTRILSPEEKKMVAYHEAGHAIAGWFLKYADPLLKVSIIPRGSAALGYAMQVPSDQFLYSTEQLFDRMCMAFGGRASELIFFNHYSTGAQNDLRKITQMAYAQVTQYGMNTRVGNMSYDTPKEGDIAVRPYSDETADVIDEEVRKLVDKAFNHTVTLLTEHKEKVDLVAQRLLDKEVLNHADMIELVGKRPFENTNKNLDLSYFEKSATAPSEPKDTAAAREGSAPAPAPA